MPSKSREYGGHFAMLDVNFVLGDPRLDLPDSAFRLYITLWILAVKERQETLPAYYYPPSKQARSGFKASTLARLARIDCRTIASAANKLSQIGLIEISSSGEITVCGVMSKHPNLKWKKRPDSTQNEFDYIETETETESKTKTETETESKTKTETETETEAETEAETETETETEAAPLSAKPNSSEMDEDCGALDIAQKTKLLYDFYIKHSGRDPGRYRLTSKRSRKIKARLHDGFTMAQMTAAIQAVLNNPWNMGENPQGRRYIELDDHIFRSYEQTEKRLREYEEKWGKVSDGTSRSWFRSD